MKHFSAKSGWDLLLFLQGAAVVEWLSSWLAEQVDRGSIPGLATWIFRDWLSPASKSRYGWKIAKSTLILKKTQPNNYSYILHPQIVIPPFQRRMGIFAYDTQYISLPTTCANYHRRTLNPLTSNLVLWFISSYCLTCQLVKVNAIYDLFAMLALVFHN